VILYLAGSTGINQHERVANKAGANNFLFTFADNSARKCAEHFCTQPQRRIFIDSGAFSAWVKGSKGKPIVLNDYIAFCKHIQKLAKCPVVFAALDVIPGKKKSDGLRPTEGESEGACEEGWDNYQTMKQEGIIPCLMTFHQLDHPRWLKRIADDCDYFAVSPRKNVSPDERLKWLEGVFRHIQPLDTSNGVARLKKKIHGLGVSSVDWMKQFPFFSVDNTGWLQGGRSHSRVHLSGSRPVFMSPADWKRRAREDGIPVRYLRKMLGYGVPGVNPDPAGNSGSYWLMELAMEAYVETERHITEHWKDRGLDLDEEQEVVAANGLTQRGKRKPEK
jgi:hypothetical protein